jgi:hypothetical protein
MPVEYGQRRGMGYRYSQDPAQQDWQHELALQYAGLPAQRALVENARQFDATKAQQKKQFNQTAATQAAQYAQTRKDANRAGMLSGLGSLVGVLGAYAGTRENGIWGGGKKSPWDRQYGQVNSTPEARQENNYTTNTPFQAIPSYTPQSYEQGVGNYMSNPNWEQDQSAQFDVMSRYGNNQPQYGAYNGAGGKSWVDNAWDKSYGGNLDRYLNTFNPAGVGYA